MPIAGSAAYSEIITVPRPQNEPRPLFVVGGLYSTANGVAWIMRDLAAALGRTGSPVRVCAAECAGRQSIGDIFGPPTVWVGFPGRWLGGLSWSPALKASLRHEVAAADVVHNHSVWMLPTSYASQRAVETGKPVMFTAHGALEPWALAHSRWKKRLAGWAFQWRDLGKASCIHVNSEPEAAGIRRLGLRQPTAVIPNGVDREWLGPLPHPSAFHDAQPRTRGRKIILFMGRLHKKKGLENLVAAWIRLQPDDPDWVLVIAGPDRGLLPLMRSMVAEANVGEHVVITGPLHGEAKRQALGASDVFVLPSFSEGFSMAVLEAMASGIPVLLTPGCNFPDAARHGAAIEVEPSATEVERGLRELIRMTDSERRTMGCAGRSLVTAAYTWDSVALQTQALYSWLVAAKPRPDFVIHA